MKKLFLIISLISVSACFLQAQTSGEFVVPLSDPAKRGKLRAHINYGSITVKGTARKDVLIKYSGEDDDDDDKHKDRDDRGSDRIRVSVNVNVDKGNDKP